MLFYCRSTVRYLPSPHSSLWFEPFPEACRPLQGNSTFTLHFRLCILTTTEVKTIIIGAVPDRGGVPEGLRRRVRKSHKAESQSSQHPVRLHCRGYRQGHCQSKRGSHEERPRLPIFIGDLPSKVLQSCQLSPVFQVAGAKVLLPQSQGLDVKSDIFYCHCFR